MGAFPSLRGRSCPGVLGGGTRCHTQHQKGDWATLVSNQESEGQGAILFFRLPRSPSSPQIIGALVVFRVGVDHRGSRHYFRMMLPFAGVGCVIWNARLVLSARWCTAWGAGRPRSKTRASKLPWLTSAHGIRGRKTACKRWAKDAQSVS